MANLRWILLNVGRFGDRICPAASAPGETLVEMRLYERSQSMIETKTRQHCHLVERSSQCTCVGNKVSHKKPSVQCNHIYWLFFLCTVTKQPNELLKWIRYRIMKFSQCCYPPPQNKYKTEGVAQLQNIQRLVNNHVNFEKKKKTFLFLIFYWFILQKKEFARFFSLKTYLQVYTKIQKWFKSVKS